MTKEEIKAGLKNAVERGYSLEQAKQSFINAGYNPGLVEEAASSLSSGVTSSYPSSPTPIYQKFQQIPQASQKQFSQLPYSQRQIEKPKKSAAIIILIIILILLLIVLVGFLIFRDKMIEFLVNLF